MPTGTDPTHIRKIPIAPHQSIKLGTSATWEKIKYHGRSFNSNANNKTNSGLNVSGAALNGHGSRLSLGGHQVFKIGENGEIFVSLGNTLEVWDWYPSSLRLKQLESDESLRVENDELIKDGLYLVASLTDLPQNDEIIDFLPIGINPDSNTYKLLLTIKRNGEIIFLMKKIGQVFEDDEFIEKLIILPPSIHGHAPFTLKASSKKFIGISTNEGSLTVFDQINAQPLALNINVKVSNDNCLFDIQGRFLVYVPAEGDELYRKDFACTKLNVPAYNKSVYSRLIESLSNSCIDGISKISENIQNFQKSGKSEIKENFKLYLSNLINGDGSKNTDSSKVILVDLETEQQLACFKPLNGVSNLSLSPYNCHLITINSRGNQIYKWDLTKIPNEIDLLDIQIRGKTSSIVEQIHWYSNNVFQIVTARSGSIHCFFTNHNSKNWILPNLEISQIGRIRINSNLTQDRWNNSNGLIAKTRKSNDLLLINLDGGYDSKYQLPNIPIPRSLLPDYIPIKPVDEITVKCPGFEKMKKTKSPLSQVEIETCFVGDPLIKNHNFEYATYLFKNGSDTDAFWELYGIFGNELRSGEEFKRVEVSGIGNQNHGDVVFHEEEDELVNAMQNQVVNDGNEGDHDGLGR